MRIPIRVKVAGSLALPLVALVAVSAYEVRQAANEMGKVRDETDLARAVAGPNGVMDTLNEERIWAAVELSGVEDMSAAGLGVTGYGPTRAATDERIRAFREDIESKGGATEETFRAALDALEELPDIRRDIDANSAPRDLSNMPFSSTMFDRYTEMIGVLQEANSRVAGQVSDTHLRQGTELAVIAGELVELEAILGRDTVTMSVMSPNGVDTPAEITSLSSELSTFDRRIEHLRSARSRYGHVVRENFPTGYVEDIRRMVTQAIDTGTIGDIADYLAITQLPPEERFPGLRQALIGEVERRADTLIDDASLRQRLFIVLSAVALLVAVVLTWLVSRSITGPMRSLTRQAREMADRRLPAAVQQILDTPPGEDVRIAPVKPVEVATRDEVSDVVKALNTVQESALDLAVEQAVLRRNISDSFVNLGRRNQNLLGRQLDFITELETNEADPDTLAGLFRLDHLATRMRRNAESLLVLAGVAPPRKWTAPVRITDVIRAALGEVEDYQRVRIEGVQPAAILGSAAADLAHLLAELIENSLTFSPPGEEVAIHGHRLGFDEGYRLTIVDQGLGMPPEAIEQANIRLAGTESQTVAPSRYLGHHVAGSLAARHDIRVRLDAGVPKGVITTVDLPSSVSGAPAAEPGPRDTDRQTQIANWNGALPVGAGFGNGAPAGALPAAAAHSDSWAEFAGPPAALPSGSTPAIRLSGALPGNSVFGAAVGGPMEPPGLPGPPGLQPGGVGMPDGGGAMPLSPPAAPDRRMTAGGLPKRTRMTPTAVTPQIMPDDLLAALESHARTIGRQDTGSHGIVGSPGSPGGFGSRPGPAPDIAPAARGVPPAPPLPPARHVASAPPPPPPPPAAPAFPAAAPPGPGMLPGPAVPPGRMAPGPQGPMGPVGPQGPAVPPAPAGPLPARPGEEPSGGGLPRRTRGAQLPTSEPMPLRRYQPPVNQPREDGRARANEVYSFLSGFSAGVQRGLDEMRGDEAPGEEGPGDDHGG